VSVTATIAMATSLGVYDSIICREGFGKRAGAKLRGPASCFCFKSAKG